MGRRAALYGLFGLIVVAAGAALAWKMWPRTATAIEYAMTVSTDIPTTVAAAPDGSVWFTIDFGEGLGIVREGKMRRVPKQGRTVEPIGLGIDASGAAWFTDPTAIAISRITEQGEIKSFPLGTPIARLARLAIGPDDAVWFAESTAYSITRLKDGVFRRHQVPSVRGGPYGVAVAADGTVWGTLQSGNQLMRITAAGETSVYDLPTAGASPTDVAVDAKGSVWLVEFRANKIARFENAKFTEYAVPEGKSAPSGIVVAPDGAIWFGLMRGGGLGRLHEGKMSFVPLPRPTARPYSLSVDRAGNVWYADISGYVGMIPASRTR